MKTKPPHIAALVVAAGKGERAGGALPKQYRSLAGLPLLCHTLKPLLAHPAINMAQVVIGPGQQAQYDAALMALGGDQSKLPPPRTGGATRQESVRKGLDALAGDDAPDIVLIHDAARPFLSALTIDALIAALRDHPAALPALAVSDSLRRADRDGFLTGDVDRDGLYRVQTPQAFHFGPIHRAHHDHRQAEVTDDAALMRLAGHRVKVIDGDEDLFKVTLPDDFARAERHILSQRTDVRSGLGFDVHRFAPGDHVWLCGVKIPHSASLAGHSDADVGLHAITDALLGAMGAGDIGDHFPPSDPKWRGADSALFLRHAGRLLTARGGGVAHIDVTLICEKPKIGPHRSSMVQRVAEILGLDPLRVSVKATTTEKLGFTGRQEGIAAQAIATIRLPWAAE